MSEDRYKSSRTDFSAKESDVISLRNGSSKSSPVSLKRKHEGRSERSSDSRSSSNKSSSYNSSRSRFSDREDGSKSSRDESLRSRGEEKSSRRFTEEKSSKSNRSSEEKTSSYSEEKTSRNSSERSTRFSEEKSSRNSAERTSRFSDNTLAPMPVEAAPVEPKAPSPPPTVMTLSKPPKKSKLTVASAFNVSEDESEEEMPLHARMKMRNMGKDTPTSSGPNSFGKTKQGFTDTVKLWDKDPVKVAQILAEKAEKEQKSG